MEKSKIAVLTLTIALATVVFATSVTLAQTSSTPTPTIASANVLQNEIPNCPVTDSEIHNVNCSHASYIDSRANCPYNGQTTDGDAACPQGNHVQIGCNVNGGLGGMIGTSRHSGMMNGFGNMMGRYYP